jgi:hypothetical protein
MAGYTRIPDEIDEVEQLLGHVTAGKIPSKNLVFVMSLIDQAKKGAGLSVNQMAWVSKWCRYATDGTNPWTGEKPAPKASPVASKPGSDLLGQASAFVPLCRRLIDLFKATEMTQPKLYVTGEDGVTYKFHRLTSMSRYPGDIAITTGRSVDRLGRIEWLTAWTVPAYGRALPEIAFRALEKFLDNPAAVAKAYGDAKHHCCFCGLDLTDERSTAAGYGPICAAKFHLPWGDKAQAPSSSDEDYESACDSEAARRHERRSY